MELNENIAAVVTGGASGLGEATARALAAKDAKVAIFNLQADKGEAVAADIGGIFCQVDVTDQGSVVAAFEKARAAHGQKRVLVCCAGVGAAIKTASRAKEDVRSTPSRSTCSIASSRSIWSARFAVPRCRPPVC